MERIRIDKYEVMEKIGQGGMSNVYKVRDVRLDKCWAMKEIDLEGQHMDKRILEQSIKSEMEILRQLEHPGLPRIIDYFKRNTKIYIVIDYIKGESLKEKVMREGAQREETVIEWALQLCDVLEYLHLNNIIYRDLKPSNVMYDKAGGLKLIDFGTARFYNERSCEDTFYLGTRGYAAPEQFGGRGQTDVRTDIYSLGITLYYLLNGRNPFYKEGKKRTMHYSKKMERLIHNCIQKDPKKRYQNCDEVRKELIKCRNKADLKKDSPKKKAGRWNVLKKGTAVAAFLMIGTASGMFQLLFEKNTGVKQEHIWKNRNITGYLKAEIVLQQIQYRVLKKTEERNHSKAQRAKKDKNTEISKTQSVKQDKNTEMSQTEQADVPVLHPEFGSSKEETKKKKQDEGKKQLNDDIVVEIIE